MALDEVDGLVDGQILLQVVNIDQLTNLVLFHLVLVSNALDLSGNFLLGSLDVLSSSNSLQSQTDLDLLLSLRHEGSAELLHSLAHILQVVLEAQALLLHAECKVVDHLVHAGIIHCLGDLTLHALDDLIHQSILNSQIVLLVQLLLIVLADGSLELVQSVVLRAILSQLVIQSRQLLVLHFVQLDLEHSSLASQFGSLILGGEGNIHVELFASGVAHDLILKAGDEAAAAQSQAVVLSLAALESHAIDEALEVDISDVAVLSSALTGQLTGIALLHTLQLSFNSLVRNSMDSLFNCQTIVAANLDFRLDSDLDGQGDTVGLISRVNSDLRTADRLNASFLDSSLESLGEQLIDGIIGKDISAVHLLDQSAGSLALTEAGNSVLLAFLLENIGNSLLESLCVDGELQFCHALLELFTLDEIHLFFLHSKILLRRAGSFCPLQPRTASWMNLLLQYAGTRALNWVQQSRQKLL